MTEPLTPANCDLTGLPFMPLDCARLLDSDLFALTTGDEFKAALALWCKSWAQSPAASLPDDDRVLARFVGLPLADWKAVREEALHGWRLCSDGRLYHPVVAEKALLAWIERLAHRDKSGKGNAARHAGYEYDADTFARDKIAALVCLHRLDPDLARSKGFLPRGDDDAPSGSKNAAPRTPPGRQKSSEGRGRGNIPVGAQTPDAEAWEEAVKLLTGAGASESKARSFFGKLLRDHKLEPHRLLTSITGARIKGTKDPQGYLTAAARGVAAKGGGKPAAPSVADWPDSTWRKALTAHERTGQWGETMGPPPGEPGCWVPAHLLTDNEQVAA